MAGTHVGFEEMSKYPFFEALFKRRSRRISLGLKSIPAGSNSVTSNAPPQPLSALEEAVLTSPIGLFKARRGKTFWAPPTLIFPGELPAAPTTRREPTSF